MTGQELYSHYWEMTYCESGAGEVGMKLPGWEELEPEEQAGWSHLAKSIETGIGCTIGWPYEPAIEYAGEATRWANEQEERELQRGGEG